MKSDDKSINIMEQLEAVRALPPLMERAVLVESHKDVYSRLEVLKVHRFYARLRIGDVLYTVNLTVSVDFPSSLKLYQHRLEKEMSSGNLPGPLHEEGAFGPTEDISNLRLHELIKDVKDNDGEIFVQHDMTGHDEWRAVEDERSLRGNILSRIYDRAAGAMTSRNGRYTIQLFRRANLSTLAHDGTSGKGRELSRDLDMLHSWTAAMDDDARLKKEYDR